MTSNRVVLGPTDTNYKGSYWTRKYRTTGTVEFEQLTVTRSEVRKDDLMMGEIEYSGWAHVVRVSTASNKDPRTGDSGPARTRISFGGNSWTASDAERLVTVLRRVSSEAQAPTEEARRNVAETVKHHLTSAQRSGIVYVGQGTIEPVRAGTLRALINRGLVTEKTHATRGQCLLTDAGADLFRELGYGEPDETATEAYVAAHTTVYAAGDRVISPQRPDLGVGTVQDEYLGRYGQNLNVCWADSPSVGYPAHADTVEPAPAEKLPEIPTADDVLQVMRDNGGVYVWGGAAYAHSHMATSEICAELVKDGRALMVKLGTWELVDATPAEPKAAPAPAESACDNDQGIVDRVIREGTMDTMRFLRDDEYRARVETTRRFLYATCAAARLNGVSYDATVGLLADILKIVLRYV